MSVLATSNCEEVEPNLSEVAYRRLRTDIVTCVLAPGRRMSERGLVAEYDLGLAAVRTALARLDQDGLVTVSARRGYTVKPLTVKAVDDLFAFWRVLAPEIVRLAVSGASADERDMFATAMMAAISGDAAESNAVDGASRQADRVIEFFDMLAESTANEYVISAYRHISGDLSRVRYLLLEDNLETAVAERAAIIAGLIRSGDAPTAAQGFQDYADLMRVQANAAIRRRPSVLASTL